MIEIAIPGGENLRLEHLVLDYNGTIALDGELVPGVAGKMRELAEVLQIHVLTADTHGTVRRKIDGLPCILRIIGEDDQDRRKQEYVAAVGARMVAAIGNGSIDALMLRTAALGICLVQREGASVRALRAADVVCTNIIDALELFQHPARLAATLRR
jgi:soluble P-type ATPase